MVKGQTKIISKTIKYARCVICNYKINSHNEAFNLKILNIHTKMNHPDEKITSIVYKNVMTKDMSHIDIKSTDVIK